MKKTFRKSAIFLLALNCALFAGCASENAASGAGGAIVQTDDNAVPVPQSVFNVPSNGDIVGTNVITKVKAGESLNSIAYNYDVGYEELVSANPGVDFYNLRVGQKIVLPMQHILPPKQYRNGIVINVAELRLYYFNNGEVMTYPVALGREGWRTPIGKTSVYRKEEQPTWNVPPTVKQYVLENHGKQLPNVVPPGPDNPLGDYAIYLTLNGYLIHGTNDNRSIGRLVSSGCIRMYNKDVSQIFPTVERGTPVYIIYYPNKVGWSDNKLYLESYKPVSHEQGIYQSQEVPVNDLIKQATTETPAAVNWNEVAETTARETGIPSPIG